MTYYAMWSDEDGITISGPWTESDLLKALDDERFGNIAGFYDKLPDIDKGCFCERDDERKLLIIRGEIAVPQPKETVTKWGLP